MTYCKLHQSSTSTVGHPDALRVWFDWCILHAVEITVAAHDTTGGMKTKISEAAVIAKLGIPVYITQVRSFIYPNRKLCSSLVSRILGYPVGNTGWYRSLTESP